MGHSKKILKNYIVRSSLGTSK